MVYPADFKIVYFAGSILYRWEAKRIVVAVIKIISLILGFV